MIGLKVTSNTPKSLKYAQFSHNSRKISFLSTGSLQYSVLVHVHPTQSSLTPQRNDSTYKNSPYCKDEKKTLNYKCFCTIREMFTQGISVCRLCHRKCHYVLQCQWKSTYFKNNMFKIILLYQTCRVSRNSGCLHGGADTLHTEKFLFKSLASQQFNSHFV